MYRYDYGSASKFIGYDYYFLRITYIGIHWASFGALRLVEANPELILVLAMSGSSVPSGLRMNCSTTALHTLSALSVQWSRELKPKTKPEKVDCVDN